MGHLLGHGKVILQCLTSSVTFLEYSDYEASGMSENTLFTVCNLSEQRTMMF